MRYIITALMFIPIVSQAADYNNRRDPQGQIYVQPETMTQEQYRERYNQQYGQQPYQEPYQPQVPVYQQPSVEDDAYNPYEGYPTQQIEQPVYPAFEQEIPVEVDEQDIDPDAIQELEGNNLSDIDAEIQTQESPTLEKEKATLQVLDKISAKAVQLQLEKGKPISFHNLDITMKRCLASPKSARIENLAYLEFADSRKESSKLLFRGWMFSSNPALNSLQHPLYDVVLLSCE